MNDIKSNWTETPPSTPGCYWVRRLGQDGKSYHSVQYFPVDGQKSGYPRHWKTLRQDTIDTLREDNERVLAEFEKLPLESFVVEYSERLIPPK